MTGEYAELARVEEPHTTHWTTKDGRRIALVDMSAKHLRLVIKMLIFRNRQYHFMAEPLRIELETRTDK